jgi:hypothetical protein
MGDALCAPSRKQESDMKRLKIENPHGAFVYDVSVIFCGRETTVEVPANSMTEAAELVTKHAFTIAPV